MGDSFKSDDVGEGKRCEDGNIFFKKYISFLHAYKKISYYS